MASRPKASHYWTFAALSIALLWGVYLLELLTPVRMGRLDRGPVPLFVPLIGTPLVALVTWWRFRSAKRFAQGAIEVAATVLKIARSGVGPHRRVRLRWEVDGRVFEKSVPLYLSVVSSLEVGGQLPVLAWKANPKRIRIPMNMEWRLT